MVKLFIERFVVIYLILLAFTTPRGWAGFDSPAANRCLNALIDANNKRPRSITDEISVVIHQLHGLKPGDDWIPVVEKMLQINRIAYRVERNRIVITPDINMDMDVSHKNEINAFAGFVALWSNYENQVIIEPVDPNNSYRSWNERTKMFYYNGFYKTDNLQTKPGDFVLGLKDFTDGRFTDGAFRHVNYYKDVLRTLEYKNKQLNTDLISDADHKFWIDSAYEKGDINVREIFEMVALRGDSIRHSGYGGYMETAVPKLLQAYKVTAYYLEYLLKSLEEGIDKQDRYNELARQWGPAAQFFRQFSKNFQDSTGPIQFRGPSEISVLHRGPVKLLPRSDQVFNGQNFIRFGNRRYRSKDKNGRSDSGDIVASRSFGELTMTVQFSNWIPGQIDPVGNPFTRVDLIYRDSEVIRELYDKIQSEVPRGESEPDPGGWHFPRYRDKNLREQVARIISSFRDDVLLNYQRMVVINEWFGGLGGYRDYDVIKETERFVKPKDIAPAELRERLWDADWREARDMENFSRHPRWNR